MAYTITQVKSLLTTAELELFDQSRAQNVKAYSAKQVGAKAGRARKLREKYRDLYQRQSVASQKRGLGADANERTQRKADVFEEVLGRFEDRGDALAAQDAKADKVGKADKSKTVTAGKKAAPRKSPASKKAGQPTTVRAAVKKALAAKRQDAGAGGGRSDKAPSSHAPAASANAPQNTAPLDMVPKAQHQNPVKTRGANTRIDGHTKVQVRQAQARRDSR